MIFRSFLTVALVVLCSSFSALAEEDPISALTDAIAAKNEHAVRELAKNITDFDNFDRAGSTPLTTAVELGDFKTARFLLEKGANVNFKDADGNSPLKAAVITANAETVSFLITRGANLKGEGLIAAAAGCPEPGDVSSDLQFETNLVEVIRLLQISGASIEEPDDTYGTPLVAAASTKRNQILQRLIDLGAKLDAVSAKPKPGTTALMVTASDHHEFSTDAYKLLVVRHANRLAKDAKGKTVLHYAAEGGNIYAASDLLEAGADINAQTEWGVTPLMLAATHSHFLTKMLLEKGANLQLRDKKGKRAVDYAIEKGITINIDLLNSFHR